VVYRILQSHFWWYFEENRICVRFPAICWYEIKLLKTNKQIKSFHLE